MLLCRCCKYHAHGGDDQPKRTTRASHAAETANTDATSNRSVHRRRDRHIVGPRARCCKTDRDERRPRRLSALCYTPITTLPALSPTRTAAIQMATLPADEKVAFLLKFASLTSRRRCGGTRPSQKQFEAAWQAGAAVHARAAARLMASTLELLVLVIADEYRDMDFLQPSDTAREDDGKADLRRPGRRAAGLGAERPGGGAGRFIRSSRCTTRRGRS